MAWDFENMTESQRKAAEAVGLIRSIRREVNAALQPKRAQAGRKATQLELDFENKLDWAWRGALITDRWVKPMILTIGPAMTFAPDFMVQDRDNVIWLIDTKGPHAWEDSRIKIKIACDVFPLWRWLIVERKAGAWVAKEISVQHGRGRLIKLPWME